MTLTCDNCRGTGLRRAESWDDCIPCPTCDGRGRVTFGWLAGKIRENERTLRDIADPAIKSNRILAAQICAKIIDLLEGRALWTANTHFCHAVNCKSHVPPRLLFCARHWKMVPRKTQVTVWNNYRPGQEIDKKPTLAYLAIQQTAVGEVAEKEGYLDEAKKAFAKALSFLKAMAKNGEELRG